MGLCWGCLRNLHIHQIRLLTLFNCSSLPVLMVCSHSVSLYGLGLGNCKINQIFSVSNSRNYTFIPYNVLKQVQKILLENIKY